MKKREIHHGRVVARRPRPDRVHQMAADLLTFLAADSDRLWRFFDLTGLSPPLLRQAAEQPGFEASLLDYIGGDEALLKTFAATHGYDPADVDAARISLTDRPENGRD